MFILVNILYMEIQRWKRQINHEELPHEIIFRIRFKKIKSFMMFYTLLNIVRKKKTTLPNNKLFPGSWHFKWESAFALFPALPSINSTTMIASVVYTRGTRAPVWTQPISAWWNYDVTSAITAISSQLPSHPGIELHLDNGNIMTDKQEWTKNTVLLGCCRTLKILWIN